MLRLLRSFILNMLKATISKCVYWIDELESNSPNAGCEKSDGERPTNVLCHHIVYLFGVSKGDLSASKDDDSMWVIKVSTQHLSVQRGFTKTINSFKQFIISNNCT